MPSQHLFSEDEASRILQRAVEISSNEQSENFTPGVTREELERIAKEVGVSPDALERAIREGGIVNEKSGLFNLTKTYERVVEGELDPGQFDLICEGIRLMGRHGQSGMSQVGRNLKLSAWTGTGHAMVDVTARNGRTSIKVKSNSLLQAVMTLHPAFVTSMVTVGALSERGMGLLGIGIATGIMTIGAFMFRFLTKLGHKRAENLADLVKKNVEGAMSETKPKE